MQKYFQVFSSIFINNPIKNDIQRPNISNLIPQISNRARKCFLQKYLNRSYSAK